MERFNSWLKQEAPPITRRRRRRERRKFYYQIRRNIGNGTDVVINEGVMKLGWGIKFYYKYLYSNVCMDESIDSLMNK